MMENQSHSLGAEEIAELTLREGKRFGCSDVSAVATRSDDSQVRFSNNTITLINNVRNLTLEVYLAVNKKRIVGSTYNPTEEGVKRFLGNLFASCNSLPPSEDYVPLPEGPFQYHGHANFDPKVQDAPLVDYVKQTIDHALAAGAKRVSGSLNTEDRESFILTTGGATGKDRHSITNAASLGTVEYSPVLWF